MLLHGGRSVSFRVENRLSPYPMLSNLNSRAGELKSQGAAQAAQDPNSSVSAHDAEQTIHDESRKAGSAAFQFNAESTPEEKAAQARSVCSTHELLLSGILLILAILASTCRLLP